MVKEVSFNSLIVISVLLILIFASVTTIFLAKDQGELAVVTGAISGAIPAWKASKTNTVDALHYE